MFVVETKTSQTWIPFHHKNISVARGIIFGDFIKRESFCTQLQKMFNQKAENGRGLIVSLTECPCSSTLFFLWQRSPHYVSSATNDLHYPHSTKSNASLQPQTPDNNYTTFCCAFSLLSPSTKQKRIQLSQHQLKRQIYGFLLKLINSLALFFCGEWA